MAVPKDRTPTKCNFKFQPGDEVEILVKRQAREKGSDGNIILGGEKTVKEKAIVDHGVRKYREYINDSNDRIQEHYNLYAVRLENGGVHRREEGDIKILRMADEIKKKEEKKQRRRRRSNKDNDTPPPADSNTTDDGPTTITDVQ
jgi:hypothetical protein